MQGGGSGGWSRKEEKGNSKGNEMEEVEEKRVRVGVMWI
jgi:hypothetical protein